MLIREIISEKPESKPIVYVDMDGVLADFFSEWAKMAGIKTGNYKDIPPANIDPTLDKMIGTDFFAQLPKFATADKLIQMIISHYGSYKILSSPLRNDHENSKKHKIDWIGRKLKIKPKETIISSNKGAYATQADGTPNILIDDLGKNIQNWMNNGGLGIKYQADEDPLSKVQQWLSQFRKGALAQESVIAEREENIFEKERTDEWAFLAPLAGVAGAVGRAVAGGAARVIPAVAKQVVKTPFRAASALRLAAKSDDNLEFKGDDDEDGDDDWNTHKKDILGRPPS